MPSVLILCAHRPKRSPSQRYRFEQYLPFLEMHGYSFEFSYLLNEQDDLLFYSKGNFLVKIFILIKSIFIRLKDWRRFGKFNIIFIQREASFLGTSFFEKRASASSARVIFDFDDSIWLADTSPGNKKWEWIKQPEKFYTNVTHANLVIAGNDYLANKAKAYNKNTVVIPTTIDTDIHIPKPEYKNKGILCIGWSGSISTIKHFELLLPVLVRLKTKYGERIKFKLVGDAHYKNQQLPIEALGWSEKTEVEDLNSFDIGLMPLLNDEWSKGKCGLKGLSYMACGVPTIMSPVGVNKEIIRHAENGFLAETEQDWYNLISQLIENKELREQIGTSGRLTVLEKYSVAANKSKYLISFNGNA